MSEHKKIPIDDFSICISNPVNRLNSYSLSIYTDGRIILNGKLSEKIARRKLDLRLTSDMKHVCLRVNDDSGDIIFPKNGSKKFDTIPHLLTKNKIVAPAKYEVWYNDEFWQGDYIENPMQLQKEKPRSSKQK